MILDKLSCLISTVITSAVCVLISVLYFEGVPVLRDIPLIGHVPLIGAIAEGEISRRTDLALAGYVSIAEKTAADAQAKEAQRQASAASQALKAANDQIASAKAAEVKASADLEQRITSYEQQLAAAHRDCLADDADVDFILHDGATADGLGHH